MSASKLDIHCYVHYKDNKTAGSKSKPTKPAGDGDKIGLLTDLVPSRFIKFKDGKPFAPEHDKDFNENLIYLCKWKTQVAIDEGYATDPENDFYDVTIIKMAPSLQQLDKWVTTNVKEVKREETAAAPNKTRPARNVQPRAIYSAPQAGPSKSSALKAIVVYEQKETALEGKDKKVDSQFAKSKSQINSLQQRKIRTGDQASDDLLDYDPTGDEAIKNEIKSLRSERDRWEKRAREAEKRVCVLEKENQTLFEENTVQRKEFMVMSANFTKLSARLLETPVIMPASGRSAVESDIKEKTRSLLKAPSETNQRMNKVKVERKEEVTSNFEWRTVAIDIPGKKAVTLNNAVKMDQLHSDPEEPDDNSGMTDVDRADEECVEIQEDGPRSEPNKTKSPMSPSLSDGRDEFQEQPSSPSSLSLEEPATSGRKSEAKQDAESTEPQQLWRPDHPIERCKKSSDGLMVNLGNNVWIEEDAWRGVKTNKDVSVFVKDLAFTMYQDGIANRSYTGRQSNSKQAEPAKLAISPAKKELLVGYYIEKVRSIGDLSKIQKKLKDGTVVIDEVEVNKKISQYVGEKSAYIGKKLKRKALEGENSLQKEEKKAKNKNKNT